MCKHDCNCQNESQSSGFIFGLFLGAIVGAVIAIVVYKNNKTKVVEELKNKLTSFFNDLSQKIAPQEEVVEEKPIFFNTPDDTVIENIPIVTKRPKPKTFVRPKK